jgi:hypothetical protein
VPAARLPTHRRHYTVERYESGYNYLCHKCFACSIGQSSLVTDYGARQFASAELSEPRTRRSWIAPDRPRLRFRGGTLFAEIC